jgi:hypothetical protein
MKILKMARLAVVLGLFLVIIGCGRNDFPKYTDLGDLRILTIIVDHPEANPGDTVTFTPVLSDLKGQGRAINYSVQGCIDPGVGIGAVPVCINPDPNSLQTGTVSISPGASQTYTGPVSTFSLTLPDAATIFSGRSSVDQYNGIAYLVFYTIGVPNGPTINSFLRVIVSPAGKTLKNQNPVTTSVDLNNSPVAGIFPMPASASDFRVTYPASSAETYQVLQQDGGSATHTEELINTWFISDGSFESSRTIGNTEDSWTPPDSKPANRGSVILVVTRDGRGGAAFQKVEMN